MSCILEQPVRPETISTDLAAVSTATTIDLNQVEQKLRVAVEDRLGDGEWYRDDEFYDLIPDDLVDVELATCSPGARTCTAEPRNFVRIMIMARIFKALRQKGGYEFQKRNGCEEIQLPSSAEPSKLPEPTTTALTPVATDNIATMPPVPSEVLPAVANDLPAADPATEVVPAAPVEETLPTEDASPEQPAGAKTSRRVEHRGQVFIIDPELAGLLGDLDPDEKKQLEANILKDKRVRDPIVRCKSTQVVLGGHHRLEVAVKHDLDIAVIDLDIPDRAAAKQWIVDDQVGRRNLTPDRLAYYRGQILNLMKQPRGGKRTASGPKGQSDSQRTDDQLGKVFGVSGKTMQRAGTYAESIDTIVGNCGADSKQLLLGQKAALTRQKVAEIAKLAPQEQSGALKKATEAKKRSATTRKRPSARKKGSGQVPQTKSESKPSAPPPADEVVIVVADDPAVQAQTLLDAIGTENAIKLCLAMQQLLGPTLEKLRLNHAATDEVPEPTVAVAAVGEEAVDEESEAKERAELDRLPEHENELADDEPSARRAISEPYHGINGETITAELCKQEDLSCKAGVFVYRVASRSPAVDAGVGYGDVIVAVNDRKITALEQLLEAARQAGIGADLSLKIIRGRRTLVVVVTLAAPPSD
jgi:hypothetical protein